MSARAKNPRQISALVNCGNEGEIPESGWRHRLHREGRRFEPVTAHQHRMRQGHAPVNHPAQESVENSSVTNSVLRIAATMPASMAGQAMMTYRVMVRYVTTISVLGLAILGHVLT